MGGVLGGPVDGDAAGLAEVGGAGASASGERGEGGGRSAVEARDGFDDGFVGRVVGGSGSARSGSARVVVVVLFGGG